MQFPTPEQGTYRNWRGGLFPSSLTSLMESMLMMYSSWNFQFNRTSLVLTSSFLWFVLVILQLLFLCFHCYPSIIRWYHKWVLSIFYTTTGGGRRCGSAGSIRGLYPLKPRTRGLWDWRFLAWRLVIWTWRRCTEFFQWMQLLKLGKRDQHPNSRNHWNGNLKAITDDISDNNSKNLR